MTVTVQIGFVEATGSIEVTIDQTPIAYQPDNLYACDGAGEDIEGDGVFSFDTTLIEDAILNGQTGIEVYYYNQNGDPLPSPLPNPYLTASQTIDVALVNSLNNSCMATTNFDFVVSTFPEFDIEPMQLLCLEGNTALELDPIEANPLESYTYQWQDENDNFISNTATLLVSEEGTYSVTLFNTNGSLCETIKTVYVAVSEIAQITEGDINVVYNLSNNQIAIDTRHLGLGDYEFSITNMDYGYQDEPFFEHVSHGVHTLFVRDKNGCGASSIDVFVIGYPKFFTPNGDGYNDYWHIKGLSSRLQSNSKIFIFNRYGKLLKQLSALSSGWDGTFNGKKLSVDDYWFKAELGDGSELLGHFTLKR